MIFSYKLFWINPRKRPGKSNINGENEIGITQLVFKYNLALEGLTSDYLED